MEWMLEDSSADTIRVLHLDDDVDLADLTATFLVRESDEFDVVTENVPEQALDRLETESIDCIISDFDMPGMDGLEFLDVVREEYPDLPFILFTGKGSEEIASDAISRGVTDYLQKETGTDQYTVLANRIENAVAQYRAEQEVERRSRGYRQILEYSSDYVMIVDESTEVSYISPAVERVMGYSQDDLIGSSSVANIHPEDREVAVNGLAKTLEYPDEEVTVEFRAEASDGSYRWLEARGSNFLDDPIIRGVMVNVRDITERKKHQQELEERNEQLEELTSRLEEQYRHLFEQAPIMGVVTRDEDDTPIVEDCNDLFVETLDLEKDDVVGRPLGDFYTPESRTKLRNGGYRRALDGEFTREDRELVTSDDEVVETVLRAVPRKDDSGEVAGTLSFYVDITEREELKREKERLEEFVNILSHDLRNPLGVATGQLELARQEHDSEYLVNIERTLDRMEVLIDDLLALARSGDQIEEKEPIDLEHVSRSCWKNVTTAEASLVVDADWTIRADRARVQQLLENLFRNAIEHGGTDVTIAVGVLEDGFYVEDDGSGIDAPARERVFESGYSTKTDGTGLGLSIVKQITEAHDWHVAVAESADGGTRFEITGVETVE